MFMYWDSQLFEKYCERIGWPSEYDIYSSHRRWIKRNEQYDTANGLNNVFNKLVVS